MSYMKNLYYDIGHSCRYEDGRSHTLCGSYFGRESFTSEVKEEIEPDASITPRHASQLKLDFTNKGEHNDIRKMDGTG